MKAHRKNNIIVVRERRIRLLEWKVWGREQLSKRISEQWRKGSLY